MTTRCKIHFDNNENIVQSGQKFGITVRLSLAEKLMFRDITIQLCGNTHVGFIRDYSRKKGSYIANDNVLYIKKNLVPRNGGEIQHLMPGTYDYSFQCTLPRNLPSSLYYWRGWGHTKYTAEVKISNPNWELRAREMTFKRTFIVYKSLDLNDFPSLQNSVTFQKEVMVELYREPHSSSDVTYPGGPFNFSAYIDSGCYVPGQFINVECEIFNNDPYHAIDSFRVELIRKIIFFKSENSKPQTAYAPLDENTTSSGCQQGQHITFTISLEIPETSPTDTESKLIKIQYEIRIIGWMGADQRKHPSISFPITIGTKPIHSSIPRENLSDEIGLPSSTQPLLTEASNAYFFGPSTSQQSDDDTVSVRTYTSTPPPFPDDDLDLPTYDEAMRFNLDDEFDMNLDSVQCSFAQLYRK